MTIPFITETDLTTEERQAADGVARWWERMEADDPSCTHDAEAR